MDSFQQKKIVVVLPLTLFRSSPGLTGDFECRKRNRFKRAVKTLRSPSDTAAPARDNRPCTVPIQVEIGGLGGGLMVVIIVH